LTPLNVFLTALTIVSYFGTTVYYKFAAYGIGISIADTLSTGASK